MSHLPFFRKKPVVSFLILTFLLTLVLKLPPCFWGDEAKLVALCANNFFFRCGEEDMEMRGIFAWRLLTGRRGRNSDRCRSNGHGAISLPQQQRKTKLVHWHDRCPLFSPPLLTSIFTASCTVHYRGHSSPRLTKSRGTFNANAAPPKKNSKPAIWRPPPSHRFPCLCKGIHPHVGTESKRSRPFFTTLS